jgi:hypothetical protein
MNCNGSVVKISEFVGALLPDEKWVPDPVGTCKIIHVESVMTFFQAHPSNLRL